jgi:hypothetical protein
MCPSLPLTSLLRLSAAHGAQIRSTMMISDTNRSTEPHQQTHNSTVLPAYIIRITDYEHGYPSQPFCHTLEQLGRAGIATSSK